MIGAGQLVSLLEEPGPWTYAYVDGQGAEPQGIEDARRESVRRRLEEAGAPEADAAAVLEVLDNAAGLPSPSARYVLARDGEVEVDESFPGARLGPEQCGHAQIPPILPLLRDRADDIRYVVVEAGRGDAEVRLERAGRPPEHVQEIEGRTDALPKVQAGGWSQSRYQRTSEEIWKHNQADVARIVDRLVQQHSPRFVVVSGDVRARQLLRDELGTAAQKILILVDAHTHAAGADRTALDEAIATALEEQLRSTEQDIVDRASTDSGSAGAHGLGAVVEALRQARVESLLLDARMLDSDAALAALDESPWVAPVEDDEPANVIERVPAAEALARAALLTGARVVVAEDDHQSDDDERADRMAREPLAVLRWSGSSPG
ncbi:Vms1/Ankzf1 family peptidyl-tRNA hydrolase [Microbacterium aurantiacum]|uniref:baeRF2 domain-containing protein n=1 Tax=Microbacterium aurantiacum TaxID=162393 RepID=UPI000C80FC6B|nr:Vms1/Ankzf1 family peptidyl-tRNA hydrolase [Microbacterium aurantiacum]